MKSIAEAKDLSSTVQHLKDIAVHLLTAQRLRSVSVTNTYVRALLAGLLQMHIDRPS